MRLSRPADNHRVPFDLPREDPAMKRTDERLSQTQRDALWKWRWLGWRESTPAFKASIAVLAASAIAIGIAALR